MMFYILTTLFIHMEKKKIWEIRDECNRLLEQEDCPTYHEEELYLDQLREERAVAKLQGTDKGVPYVS